MLMTGFARGVSLAIALLTASARADVVVQLPCDDSGKSGFRSCAFVLTGNDPSVTNPGGGIPGAPDPGVQNLLHDRMQMHVQALHGLYRDKNNPAGPPIQYGDSRTLDLDHYPGELFGPLGKNVCDILGDDALGNPAPELDHYNVDPSHSCGNPIKIDVRLNLGAVNGSKSCGLANLTYTCLGSVNPSATYVMSDQYGTQEAAYLQGAYEQALSCFYQKKVSEIASQHQITIEDINKQPSECASMAQATIQIAAQGVSAYQGFLSAMKANGLEGTAQYADIVNCKKTWANDPSTQDNPKLGNLRQQAQQLCAARAAIESAFYRLAECQVFALARAAWLNNIVDDAPPAKPMEKFWTTIIDKVATPCANYCADWLKGPSKFNVPSSYSQPSDLGSAVTAIVDCTLCTGKCIGTLGTSCDCDISDHCPVKSPYQSVSDWVSSQTKTYASADQDVNQCVTSCYQSGVSNQSPDGVKPPVTIPSYKTVIQNYLQSLWPKDASSCQLDSPTSSSAVPGPVNLAGGGLACRGCS